MLEIEYVTKDAVAFKDLARGQVFLISPSQPACMALDDGEHPDSRRYVNLANGALLLASRDTPVIPVAAKLTVSRG